MKSCSDKKLDYFYCNGTVVNEHTVVQPEGSPTFSPQPTYDVPVPSTLALIAPVLVAAMLWRKR